MIGKSLFFAVVLSLIFTVAVLAAPNYQEGLWEMTTTMDMPGLQKEMKQPYKSQVCLTKQNPVPQPKDKQCKMTDQKTVGDTIYYTITCKNGRVIKGETTYGKTSFNGFSTTTMSYGGSERTMKYTISGKYIGPCSK